MDNETRGYPKLMRVIRVGDDSWISQHEAARQLEVAVVRIGALISCGHLTPAENPAGHAGVTISSLRDEKSWRNNATIRLKIVRLLKDVASFI